MQSLRLARRLPGLQVPSQKSGVVSAYDCTDDWIPIYDRTSLDGYYVAIGTSGHQFKAAPFVGVAMAALVDAVEAGHDHDDDPSLSRASGRASTSRSASSHVTAMCSSTVSSPRRSEAR